MRPSDDSHRAVPLLQVVVTVLECFGPPRQVVFEACLQRYLVRAENSGSVSLATVAVNARTYTRTRATSVTCIGNKEIARRAGCRLDFDETRKLLHAKPRCALGSDSTDSGYSKVCGCPIPPPPKAQVVLGHKHSTTLYWRRINNNRSLRQFADKTPQSERS